MKIASNNRSNVLVNVLAASLILLGGAHAGAGAQAAQPESPLTKKVVYGDLNLETETGAKILYSRLRHAAQDVCSPFEGRDPSRQVQWRTCYDQAVTAAVARVNNSRVTALHNQTAAHPGQI